jgi:hypothetical protein
MTLFTTPAAIRCRKAMNVVDTLGAASGSVDATNPDRVVVQFPSHGLGDIDKLVDRAADGFRAAGFQPLTMDVNDRTARFTMRLAA